MSEAPEKQKRDRIGIILTGLYICLLVASVAIIGKIIYIQLVWKPSSKIETALTPRRQTRTL